MKKTVCSLLAVAMLVSFLPFASFARFDYIASMDSGLTISSMGRASCGGGVTLWDDQNSCVMTIDLQMNDGGWGSLKTWVVNAGDGTSETKYYYVESGHYYKVIVTIDVYNPSGRLIESESLTSSTVYY